MGKEKRLLPIKEAFQLAQQPHQNQAKLVVALNRTYGSVSAAARDPGPASPLPGLSPRGFPLPSRIISPRLQALQPSRPGSKRPMAWTVNSLAANLREMFARTGST